MSPLLPLIASWIGGAVLLLADGRRRWVAQLAAVILLMVAAADLWLLLRPLGGPAILFETTTGGWPVGIGIRLHVDGLALFFGLICAAVLAAVMQHEATVGAESRILPGLLLLMCAGLHGAFFTGDLFNFYVFFELAVVTSIVLAVYGYGRVESRGAFIYMAVNLLGSTLFLVGVIGVYHAVGTLDFGLLASTLNDWDDPILLPGALLLTGLAFKLGLFPFHGWVPVVYSHARPPIAAALAGALVNLGAYGLLRIGLSVFPDAVERAQWLLLALGSAATFYGALLALARRTPAELAAYLAIAQAGYVMIGFGLGSEFGIVAVLLVVLTGSLDKTMMFLALDARGQARMGSAMVAAISTAGLPLTFGFVAKIQLLHAVTATTAHGLVLLVLLASTLLIIAASVRYWHLARVGALPGDRRGGSVSLLVLPAVSVMLGLAPAGVGELASRISATLLEQSP